MGDISEHFNRWEFECKCNSCGRDAVDVELLMALEDLRKHFNQPVYILSANRCTKHNIFVGGAKHSMHLKSKASDVVVTDIRPEIVYEYLIAKYPDKYGIGRYDSFVHLDVRQKKTRWRG